MYFTPVRIISYSTTLSVESTKKNIHLLCGRERHYKNNPKIQTVPTFSAKAQHLWYWETRRFVRCNSVALYRVAAAQNELCMGLERCLVDNQKSFVGSGKQSTNTIFETIIVLYLGNFLLYEYFL